MMNVQNVTLGVIIALLIAACGKETLPQNPYSNNTNDTTQVDTNQYDPISFFALHKDIFKPSCANSGCHDGNFEPDFRTVESSYYGLINVKPIKTDFGNNFPARVIPGDASKSMLLHRMTVDLNGNSGIMPLALEPNSTYNQFKLSYIQRITQWIQAGSPDIAGNIPTSKNFPPQIQGVAAIQNNSMLSRAGKYEALSASIGSPLTIYFSLSDDQLDQVDLQECTINWSSDPDTFDIVNEVSLLAGPEKIYPGLDGKSVKYWFNYEINTSNRQTLDVLWFRITIKDNSQKILIPNKNSMFPLKKYFAIKFN